jgi:hypothetical protein
LIVIPYNFFKSIGISYSLAGFYAPAFLLVPKNGIQKKNERNFVELSIVQSDLILFC